MAVMDDVANDPDMIEHFRDLFVLEQQAIYERRCRAEGDLPCHIFRNGNLYDVITFSGNGYDCFEVVESLNWNEKREEQLYENYLFYPLRFENIVVYKMKTEENQEDLVNVANYDLVKRWSALA